MANTYPDWLKIEEVIAQLVHQQQETLLSLGRKIVPTLTLEDTLQPNDFPELENHPLFRYEEGSLAGLLTVQMALRALQKSNS